MSDTHKKPNISRLSDDIISSLLNAFPIQEALFSNEKTVCGFTHLSFYYEEPFFKAPSNETTEGYIEVGFKVNDDNISTNGIISMSFSVFFGNNTERTCLDIERGKSVFGNYRQPESHLSFQYFLPENASLDDEIQKNMEDFRTRINNIMPFIIA